MLQKSFFLAAAMVLCACGDSTPPLSPAFAGQFTGVSSTVLTGGVSFTANSTVVVAVDGSSATVASVCPIASGAATFSGTGDSATLSANTACPAIAVNLPDNSPLCGSLAITFLQGTATLVAGNDSIKTLTVAVMGQAVGCGNTYPVSNTFTGFQ